MKKLILFVCAFLSILVSQEKINKTFNDVSSIEIQVSSSDFFIKKSSNDKVIVDVKHTFDDDELPVIEKRGSRLVIKEESRNRSWSSRGSATYKLQIPDGLRISYSSGSGEFNIENVNIEKGSFNTGSADFNIQSVEAKKSIRINSGSSDVEMRNISGEVQINTGSGDVTINKIKGSVSFNAGSGDIKVKQLTIIEECSFNNGSGNAFISLADKPKSDISMNSGSGSLEIAYNGNEIDAYVEMRARKARNMRAPFKFDKTRKIDNWNNRYVEKTAKVGNGSIEIQMHTGSGKIEITK